MMPQTVPNRPTNGVTAPVMASHGRFRSKRVISSEEAICIERCTASGLRNPPLELSWRSNSRNPEWNTPIRGEGRNWSETALMSCKRWARRKARKKRPLWTRARRSTLHLERMMAQEIRLNTKSSNNTACATGPVSRTRSTISPPIKTAGKEYKCIVFGELPELDYRRRYACLSRTYSIHNGVRRTFGPEPTENHFVVNLDKEQIQSL